MGEHLFERLARERNITVEEMRAIISAALKKDGMILTRRSGHSGGRYLVRAKFLRQMNGYGTLLRNCRRKVEKICYGGILICEYNKTIK